MIQFLLLVNRQGKIRLAKWYTTISQKEQAKIIRDVTQKALKRTAKMSNIVELNGRKYICRRYAALYFIACIEDDDNELIALQAVHFFVEVLDKYFGNVCELDLIFNFHRAYFVLDDTILAGEMVDARRAVILQRINKEDALAEESEENIEGSSIANQVSNALRRL